ncbi:energy-coupling factor transporter transmembrane protein EcfT [Actinomyces sp. B33]|uniref:energy-coupling factor transporter transmembrane component T n=1 Tax=Actinomyces sp. B33 TaxID=2942131 RepID=UPI00233FCD49|nr:energy-coupling factor transporter transmembrane component T [Actinomyces sp. B33]MDC4233679.1 energy-coupling factor transporter transmembrane protein EcfT [Actinomyces sp. B33]
MSALRALSAPGAAKGLGPALDTRTRLAVLLCVNAVALGRSSLLCAFVCAGLVSAMLASIHRALAAGAVLAVAAAGAALHELLPPHAPGAASAVLAGLGFWAMRFAVCAGTALWLLATTRVGALAAALDRLRVPRAVVIPLTVMLRFLPVVVDEARAVVDAMRLRGVVPGAGSWARHPVRVAEYVMMPLLAATMRVCDDLAASAILRGLGGPARRTSIVAMGFGATDAAAALVLVGLVALRLSAWGGL